MAACPRWGVTAHGSPTGPLQFDRLEATLAAKALRLNRLCRGISLQHSPTSISTPRWMVDSSRTAYPRHEARFTETRGEWRKSNASGKSNFCFDSVPSSLLDGNRRRAAAKRAIDASSERQPELPGVAYERSPPRIGASAAVHRVRQSRVSRRGK